MQAESSVPASGNGQRILMAQMTRPVFALLIGAVCAHFWFASTPLPLGGPNVWLAALAVAGASLCLAVSLLRAGRARRAGKAACRGALFTRLGDLRPIAPALVAVALVLAWAAVVSAANGAWDVALLGKMALGAGVLFAVYLCVDTARRCQAFALAILGATGASALFGLLLLWFGDPFTRAWLWIAAVPSEQLHMLFHAGTSGLAVHPSTFGCQLATAMPVAVSALLWMALRPGGRCRGVGIATFAVVAVLLAALLLVNGSRAAVAGTVVGLGVVAWLWLRLGAERRKTVGVLALVLIALMAEVGLWWVGLGGTQPLADAGDMASLVGGRDASRRDATWARHRIEGHEPGVDYEVALQVQHVRGRGRWHRATVTADADGAIALAWHPPANAGTSTNVDANANADASARPNVLGYRVKSRRTNVTTGQWPVVPLDEYFNPQSPTSAAAQPRTTQRSGKSATRLVVDLNAIPTVPRLTWPPEQPRMRELIENGDPNVVGGAVRLHGAGEHTVQVRTLAGGVFGPAAQTWVTPSTQQCVALYWRGPATSATLEYQFRSRTSAAEDWGPWRNIWARKIAHGPAFGTLGVGSRGLADDPPAVGHAFHGLPFWPWQVVQIRTRHANGFGTPLETATRSDFNGNLVLVWAEPGDPDGVLGYQFRRRDVDSSEWQPWRDFRATLSSRVPVPVLVGDAPGGDDTVHRHTLQGLIPGFLYRAQMRAWNEHGFGGESAEVALEADVDGALALAWRTPAGTYTATGYQFRLRHSGLWRDWRDMAQAASPRRGVTQGRRNTARHEQRSAVAAAREPQGRLGRQHRLARGDLADTSVLNRLRQVGVLWRYTLDHPLGTGRFTPAMRHLHDNPGSYSAEVVLGNPPHNQFAHMLGLFGVPGLVLHVLFYALVARAAFRCARPGAQPAAPGLRFLAASAVGACSAYFVNSLLLPVGPLLGDWDHFFVIGLLFCVARFKAAQDAGA